MAEDHLNNVDLIRDTSPFAAPESDRLIDGIGTHTLRTIRSPISAFGSDNKKNAIVLDNMASENSHAHRLGKRELGPYAFEEQMPHRVARILKDDGNENVIFDVIPRLAQLLEASSDVQVACLCNKNAVLVTKLASEGLSHSDNTLSQVKSIGELQSLIEHAWEQGFNADSLVQTGGIKGTRKHIGTPEAEALLQSLDVRCTGSAFGGSRVVADLFASLDSHFGVPEDQSEGSRTIMSDRMPVFLQRPKHSVLVVGTARLRDGSRMLLVFDPALPTPLNIRGTIKSRLLRRITDRLQLGAFRKSEKSLKRWTAYETITIDPVKD